MFTGNGGFGGTVHMETKDAPDLLREGRDVGAMLKYGYHSNDQQKIYSGAVFGRSEDRRVDALLYLNGRDGRDMKLADNLPLSPTDYPINPKRLPNSAQDEKTGLFKLNLHPTEEHDLGFTYLRSKSSRWTPFSASSYPTPPSQWTIDRYGYELGLTRLLAHRDTTDTTWTGKYNYHPLDNPWIDLQLSYSDARLATGGGMRTEYQDKVLELQGPGTAQHQPFRYRSVQHELTLGAALQARDILMHMPARPMRPRATTGWLQPAFMPAGKQDTQSFYIQDAITYGSPTVTPSMRFDSVRNDGQANLAPIYDNPKLGHDYRAQTLLRLVAAAVGVLDRDAEPGVLRRLHRDLASAGDRRTVRSAEQLDHRRQQPRPGRRAHPCDPWRQRDQPAGPAGRRRQPADPHHVVPEPHQDEIFRTCSVGCRQQSIDNGSIGGSCGDMLPLSNYRNLPGLTIKGFEIESFYDSQRLFGSLSYSWMTGKHDGAYSNPWGPNVGARHPAAEVGGHARPEGSGMGRQARLAGRVRAQDRPPAQRSLQRRDGYRFRRYLRDHAANDSYDTHRLFAEWVPAKLGLKDTRIDFTVDNLFNRSYRQPLGGDLVYSQGRNAKISVTQFF